MTRYKKIDDFPGYSVGDDGTVWNDQKKRQVQPSVNQQGIPHVALGMGHGQQRRRSVAPLVAEAFLPPPNMPHFDTVINLNGDRFDCRARNLAWRPRWFAIKYHQQFTNNQRGYRVPIRDKETGVVYDTSWEAAKIHGLIDREILIATQNRTAVFPTYQMFEVIE